jgi:hypothetical protein
MEWGITKLNEIMPDADKLAPKPQASLLNSMIHIYNAFLQFLVQIVTHSDLFEIPFPAAEASIPNIEWNSVQTFQFLRQAGKDALLPTLPIPNSNFASTHEVINLYLFFIDMLSSLPHANPSELDRLRMQIPEFISMSSQLIQILN